MEHHRTKLFGSCFDVLTLEQREWIIGVQLAQMLGRETFNLYRSLKLKNIQTVRASAEQVDMIISHGCVRSGTHSVTLIPYDDAMYFLADLKNQREPLSALSGKYSFVIHKPRLHRRKPAPWAVRRSFKREEFVGDVYRPLCASFGPSSESYASSQKKAAAVSLLLAASRGV